MKRSALVGLLAMSSLSASFALDDQWEFVAMSPDKTTYYINPSSMKTNPDGSTTVWVRTFHMKPVVSKKFGKFRTSKTLITYMCGKEQSLATYEILLDNNDNVLASYDLYAMTPIVPGSIGQGMYDRICPPM